VNPGNAQSMQTSEIKQYGQYIIEADPQKLRRGVWTTYLVISRERPGGPRMRPFDDDQQFDNRIDAVKHCFSLGKRIIDGQEPGCRVDDL